MSEIKDDSFYELFDKAIGAAQEANSKDKTNDILMVKQAKVVGYDSDTYKTFVYFIDDINQVNYTLYNKTGETLSEGDTVKVYYTTNPAKGWIGMRCGEPNISVDNKPLYISAKVANTQSVSYDAIERGILSVDFNVDGTDSDVVFAGNQLCDTTDPGTLDCVYKVDGAAQDFKPAQLLTAGKHIVPHLFPMTLNMGKHNFAVFILSPDGGKGSTGISEFVGALSGQISGLRNNAPPNENLVLYFADVPVGTEIELPARMYSFGSGANKFVDWGDGSPVEESAANSAVVHTYSNAGNYTVTIKSDCANFGADSYIPTFSDNFNAYITRIYFPDGAGVIMWGNKTGNFSNLETIVFGKSATYISWNFAKSPKITSLFIPETTRTLILFSFGNTGITSFIVPKNVTSMGSNSISLNSASLTALEIYSSATPYEACGINLKTLIVSGNAGVARGFSGCTGLYDVTLGESVTVISANAFQNCSSLSGLVLPPELTTIGNYAFAGSGLADIDIPAKVTSLGYNAFLNCKSLTSARIGGGVSNIGRNAFDGCSSLKSVNIPENVAEIKEWTFRNCTLLPSIVIPDKVTSIGATAFNNCKSLTSVRVGAGVTIIRHSAFLDCLSLSDINFPEGLATIEYSAFENTGAISPVFPKSLTSIGSSAFEGSGITSAVLRAGMTCDTEAFMNSGLQELTIEDGFGTIPSSCFYGTKSLGQVHIPGSVTSIGNRAFASSSADVSFSEGVSTIGEYSFSNTGIVNLDLPSTVTSVGRQAFYNCLSLQSVSLHSRITLGQSTFSSCTSLTSVDMGETDVIPQSCFSGCTNLNSVNFAPNTAIKSNAFQNCGFSSLSLDSIERMEVPNDYGGYYNIGSAAFYGCKSLARVDGFEYKWDVIERCAHYDPVYDDKGNITRYEFSHYTYSTVAKGIYNKMSAVCTDSSLQIFGKTALKTATDYPDKKASTTTEKYSYYNQTSRNPEFPEK